MPTAMLELCGSYRKKPDVEREGEGGGMGPGDEDEITESRSQSICTIADDTRPEDDSEETFLSIGAQVLIPFLVAGMGMVGAGIYFSHIQTWPVFKEVPEIIILVPSLLGLKGNLEMTLASRLSTEANLGHMDEKKERLFMIIGNLILVQCQAIVVALLSSIVAVIMVLVLRQQFSLTHSLMLCACSLITASFASFFLGLVTAAVISLSRYMSINPDNVATPIAASLGDITSLALLSCIASVLYDAIEYWWISPIIMAIYISSIPLWFCVTMSNKYTKNVLYTGWVPVIVAMIISTIGGCILDMLVTSFRGLAVFQPVINGVGGNLVSVQASRLSTDLHRKTTLGTLPPGTKIVVGPIAAFFSMGSFSVTARVLMFLVIPGHCVFIYSISILENFTLTPPFIISYLLVSVIQVGILLYLSYILTHYFWSRNVDPDNSTIPYLTAAGDLLGIILLGICFQFLSFVEG